MIMDENLPPKTDTDSVKKIYFKPVLVSLIETNIHGGNTSNNAEATGGLWQTHS